MLKQSGGKSVKNATGNHKQVLCILTLFIHFNIICFSPNECNHIVDGHFIHYKPQKATEGKEFIETYDADGKRVLIVPNRDPIDRPVVLGESEFKRLKEQAHVSIVI